ncbi:right-handed parallel beta-helix repeat-containing protein [Cohnella zeiphila]|uniref:Right-handed parallel beta-helix repeat-containing protein n=1 Tax=Cohnella zeiphila TaxID=2761120 RepID=A0A7X0SJ49_9BACL|nr:right-handed parallel beta-helix repeat-containing protein [Cohnella zeiphila]MBB6730917.1 right-handed parallel beta-helix repeat-containing protein [Cohnella zeiphila]
MSEARQMTVYVAADGSDAGSGTLGEPLASLAEALSRTRKAETGAFRRIVVRGGSYYDVALELTERDSGLTIEAYEGEHPVLYGGKPLVQWERRGDWLAAKLEGAEAHSRAIRLLEIGGESRPRARLPESGAFRHRNRFDAQWMSTLAGGWERPPTEEELTVLRYEEEDLGPWLDEQNAEITVYHEWDESLVGVRAVDAAMRTVLFAECPGHPPGAFADRNERAREYVVWNVSEGMTKPGQWFHDRAAGEIVYWPRPGERADRLNAVVPTRGHVLRLRGGVRNVVVRGLAFSCAAAALVPGGFAASEASAAIVAEEVRDVSFANVTVRHAGGWAFRLRGERIGLLGCLIHHTGAGGVHYEGDSIALSHCQIREIGLVYGSAVAVLGGGNGNAVRHCDIRDTPYSGIVDTGSDSDISGNLFYRVMTFMKDGAAVYCTGSKRTRVTGNAVLADPGRKARSYAYYLDELCEDATVEGNLAFETGLPMLSHMTRNCRYAGNVFWDSGPQRIEAANTFGLSFERNVLVAERIDFYAPRGNPGHRASKFDAYPSMSAYSSADGFASLRDNVMYSRSGSIVFHEYVHYEVVSEFPLAPEDGNVFADPGLTGLPSGEIGWEPSSPAGANGIRPLALANAGCSRGYAELYRICGGA